MLSSTVPAGDFLIVFADGEAANALDLHASISLKASGPGILYLIDSVEGGLCILDVFSYDFTPMERNGCRECNDRGYRGRVAVYEVMPFWDGLKELVINGSSAAELKQEAIRLGFRTLRMSALNKVKLGVTSLSEAIGNTAPDRF